MIRQLIKVLLLSLVAALLISGDIAAFEFSPARSAGLGGAVLLSRATAATLLSVPVIGIETGELLIEMAGEKRFELSSLNTVAFAAAYRYQMVTAALGMMQFGYRDFYAERTLKGSLSYQHQAVTVGVNVSGMIIDFGGAYGALRGAAVGFGLSANYRNGYFAFTADDLNSPVLHEAGTPFDPKYIFYGEYLTGNSFSTVGRLSFEKNQKKSFTIGQFFSISKKANLFWSFSTGPTKYGAGLEIAHNKLKISYATSIHPVLGFTHKMGLLLSFGRKSETKEDIFE